MTDHAPTPHHVNRFSSLGRPLDPAWPTNRAVLLLVPAGSILAGVLGPHLPGLSDTGRLWAAVLGGGTVLGTWALGRELAPDDQRAAFVSMAFGFGALLTFPGISLVLLFATLMLVRVINRTVGLPARALDGVAVVLLSGWAIADTVSPGVGVVAALTFAADALLPEGRRSQWGFAALCLVMVGTLAGFGTVAQGVLVSRALEMGVPEGQVLATTGVVTLLMLLTLIRTRSLTSTCDATGAPVSAVRVRWGIAVALLMGGQALFLGGNGAAASSLLWASMAGVGLSGVAPPGQKPDGA